MGGVDRGDQLRQYYHLRLKSRKFYKYIFWFLVDVSITNTYILHKAYGGAHSRASNQGWSPPLPHEAQEWQQEGGEQVLVLCSVQGSSSEEGDRVVLH